MGLFGPDVNQLEADGDVEGLIKALGSTFKWKSACDALVRIGEPTVEPLIDALGGSNWAIRQTAMTVLGELGDTRAVEPLINILADNNLDARINAAEALGILGDIRAIDPLKKILWDEDIFARKTVAKALKALGEPVNIKITQKAHFNRQTIGGASGHREPVKINKSQKAILRGTTATTPSERVSSADGEKSSAGLVLGLGVTLILLGTVLAGTEPSCEDTENLQACVDDLENYNSQVKLAIYIHNIGLVLCFIGLYLAIADMRQWAEKRK